MKEGGDLVKYISGKSQQSEEDGRGGSERGRKSC